jgi:hypothetical protein
MGSDNISCRDGNWRAIASALWRGSGDPARLRELKRAVAERVVALASCNLTGPSINHLIEY